MDFHIPVGLTEMLQEFTVVVLRERPDDIVDFAAEYFSKLKTDRKNPSPKTKPKGVCFMKVENGADSSDSDDEPMPEPPMNRFNRRKSVCAEAYNPDDDESDDEDMVIHPKSDGQRRRLNEAVKNILLFKNLENEQLSQVLDAMFEKRVIPEEHIIDQGDDGDNFYVIDDGTFNIYVDIDGMDKQVGVYTNKGSFGELALMYNTPRAATIVATSKGTIWALDRVTFRKILLKAAYKKRKMQEALIDKVPMLSLLQPYERMNIADALETKHFSDGECIIKQGDGASCMYFIVKGDVSVRMTNTGSRDEVEITTLSDGAYFGELALVTHKPRAASIYATGKVCLAELDIMAFERLLGPCMNIMKRSIGTYEDQLQKLGISNKDLR